MTDKNLYFELVYTDETHSHIREQPTGREPIDPLNIGYTEYVRDVLGGDASKITRVPGNQYVTIAKDGTVTYDSTTAAADAAAAAEEAARPTIEDRMEALEALILSGGA